MIKGIDVSNAKGKIDWNKVKASGINAAIIRAGYGINNIDKSFIKNINGAIKAGIEYIGVYWFIYALNEEQCINNALKFYDTCRPYLSNINLGFWADFEYDSDSYLKKYGLSVTKAQRTEWVNVFMKTLSDLKLETVGYYANKEYLNKYFNSLSGWPLWYAYYSGKTTKACYIQQYSSAGNVDGIGGNVDMDYINIEVKTVTSAATAVTLPVLKKGSKGTAVKVMQSIVGTTVDGSFGSGTEKAVKTWQATHGLTADGSVGKATWTAMLGGLVS